MKTVAIIGISGHARAGKDTAADTIVRDFNFVSVALADSLKRLAKEAFAFTDEQLWGDKKEEPDKRYPREHTRLVCYCTACAKTVLGDQFESKSLGRIKNFCGWCGTGKVGLDNPDLHWLSIPEYLTPRHALQQLGTEWGRACYPDVWVDYLVRVARDLLEVPGDAYNMYTPREGVVSRIEFTSMGESHRDDEPQGPYRGVVVPDVRFKNEIEGLRRHGAKLIRILRPGTGLTGAAAQHVSETEQDGIPDSAFDAVIPNTGSLEDLRALVGTAVASFTAQ